MRDANRTDKYTLLIASDILLVGHPNVGKSVLFSRMTGVRTVVSNYPGTTVGYIRGRIRLEDQNYNVVDAPGTYSLEPLDEAANVAVKLIDRAKRIINVIDATHLERQLPLTIKLLAQCKPMVVALNMSDEARHRGIEIDVKKLSDKLGVAVIPTVARSGVGLRRLIQAALALPLKPHVPRQDQTDHRGPQPHNPHHSEEKVKQNHLNLAEEDIWSEVGAIVNDVQTLHDHRHTLGEILEDISVHPVWGGFAAAFVIFLSFGIVRLIGEFLIGGGIGIFGEPWIVLPFGTELLFDVAWKPLVMKLSNLLQADSFLHQLIIGSLIDGEIDFQQSFGLLTSGLFIPLGVVLPYIFSFYLVLSLLEDTGYLPRLAVFLDNIMHWIGLHGYAIIPTLLGLGCNVPGVMATRILESRRQRFITTTLISIAVPCAALQAMIIGFVGKRGIVPVLLVYSILFLTWMIIGIILRYTTKGFLPELLIEIPPYRAPSILALCSKMWMRVMGFLKEALPVVMVAILVVNLLYVFRVFEHIAYFTAPVVTKLWGLPQEAILPLLIGILRKDVAIGMFAPLELTTQQLITGSVILSMFFPCIATFVILLRELKIRDGLKATGIMLISVLFVGIAVNLFLDLIF
jgi:ferrous iron transport protein B